MSQKLDPYRILQVRPDATPDEVKVAFRRLARRYHPDRANDAISAARMIEVNQAWEILGDPVRRAAHDRANGIVVRQRQQDQPESDVRTAAHAPSGGAPIAGNGAGASGPGDGTAAGAGATVGSAGSRAGEDPLPPPRRPNGQALGVTLHFGRYEGWTFAEIARVEPEYLEWLVRMPIGWQYRNEINAILQPRAAAPEPPLRTQPRRRGFLGR